MLLVRTGGLSFHGDLVHSAQAATEIPVGAHCYWGNYGNNFDFFAAPQNDSRDENYEILAVSPEGHVLLVQENALIQSRTKEEFDERLLFAPSETTVSRGDTNKVTSVLIAAPGVYLLGTSRGDVFRLRRQGRVLQTDQLRPPAGDWLSALREKGKQFLMPVLQAAMGSAAAGGGAKGSPRDSPVTKLLLVPNSHYLLACGDQLSLWSDWDKGSNEQSVIWTVGVKLLIEEDLRQIKLKGERAALRSVWRSGRQDEQSQQTAEVNSFAHIGGTAPSMLDRFSFGSSRSLGAVQIVDCALLHDDNESSWGSLVLLVQLTPEGALSSNLWMFTLELNSQAPPTLGPRAFVASGVHSRPRLTPALHTMLPSWRVYLSWVDKNEMVVFGQLDVRALAVLSAEISPSESVPDRANGDDGSDVEGEQESVDPAPGIRALVSDLVQWDVAAITTAACTGYGSKDRSRQKLDGLLVLRQSETGGELRSALPPLGATSLPWAPASTGARSYTPLDLLRSGSGAKRDGDSLSALLLCLRTDAGILSGNVTAGAVRDAIARVSQSQVLTVCSAASLAVVDLREEELQYRSDSGGPPVVVDATESLAQRQGRHGRLVEVLAGAGVLGDAAILAAIQRSHESVFAATAMLAESERQRYACRSGPGSEIEAGTLEAVRICEAAMGEVVRRTLSSTTILSDGLALRDVAFSRPSTLPLLLSCVAAALEGSQRDLSRRGEALETSLSVAQLLHAALHGAAEAVVDVSTILEVSSAQKDLSSFACDSDVRLAALRICKVLGNAAVSEAAGWRSRAGEERVRELSEKICDLAMLVLLSYKVEASKSAPKALSTTHMPVAWQRQQRKTKLAFCDALLALGQADLVFRLCCEFKVLERLIPSSLLTMLQLSPTAGDSGISGEEVDANIDPAAQEQVENELFRLMRLEGEVEVLALAPAAAAWPPTPSPVPLDSGSADGSAQAQLGSFCVAEYAFMWIESHEPGRVTLQLDLRLAAPEIFRAYAARRGPDTPAMRLHYGWMAAMAALREGDGDADGEGERSTRQELATVTAGANALLRVSSGALEASAAASSLATAEGLAAIAKLSAYAAGKEDKGKILGARERLLASHRDLLRCELQKKHFPRVTGVLSETSLLGEMLKLVREGQVVTHAQADALLDCLKLLSIAAQCSPQHQAGSRSGLSDELLKRLEEMWSTAVSACPRLRELGQRLGSGGGQLGTLSTLEAGAERELLDASLVATLQNAVWGAQRESVSDFPELASRIPLELAPAGGGAGVESVALINWERVSGNVHPRVKRLLTERRPEVF